jgi:WD40 repeat protein
MKRVCRALVSLSALLVLVGEAGADDRKPKTDLYGDPLPPGAIARCGTMRLRHDRGVSALVLSRDGKQVISGGEDGTVRVWDLVNGRELRRFKTSWPFIAQLALSPDGRLLGAVANDGRKDDIQGASPRLWDLTTGKELAKQPPYKSYCYSLAFAPDGKTVAIGSLDGVRLWDVAAGRELLRFPRSALALAFSPDGKTLASAADGQRICLWQTNSGKELRSMRSPERMTTALAFSPDGKLLVSASRWQGKAVYVWDPHTGKELRRLGAGGSLSLVFSPDSRILATTGRLCLWDPATGKALHQFKVSNRFIARAFTPDGKALVGSYGETIGVLELTTGKIARRCAATAVGRTPLPSAPTAGLWLRAATTARPAPGTRVPAGSDCCSRQRRREGSARWPSLKTAGRWRRSERTARFGSGGPLPENRCERFTFPAARSVASPSRPTAGS